MSVRIDSRALSVLEALEAAGYEAYLVGGCVRDIFMGREPHDWDIATSARPEETTRICRGKGWSVADFGGRLFGTIVAVIDGVSYEITTFRREFYGGDGHRPETVVFSHSLYEDVSRRDFTVNAMALDRNGVLYDYHDGLGDLKRRQLRTVGKAEERFREDPLRLFRACRFLGQLNFTAEASLTKGMGAAFFRVEKLSLERIREEVERLLLTPYVERGLDLFVRSGLNACRCRRKKNGIYESVDILPELTQPAEWPQIKNFQIFNKWEHTLATVHATKSDLTIRWAALLHHVAEGMSRSQEAEGSCIKDGEYAEKGGKIAKKLLFRWGKRAGFCRRVSWLVAHHPEFHYFVRHEEADAVKWVRRFARSGTFSSKKEMREALAQLTALCCAAVSAYGDSLPLLSRYYAFGEYLENLCRYMPVSTKELQYDAEVIAVLGNNTGKALRVFLAQIQSGRLENEPKALSAAAVRYMRRHRDATP